MTVALARAVRDPVGTLTAPRGRHRAPRAAERPAGLRRRPWRVDPLLPVSCLVAAVVYLAHGFDGVLTRDLGVYAYAGQRVADGVPPYVGILNRAGPLAHLLPGIGVAGARAVGADDLVGARVLFMLLSVAAVGVAYLLGRDLFRSRLAGLACAAALLSFEGFTRYATGGPREKTAMVLFLLCALLAMAHRRWATTGCFVALATLTWQPVLFAGAAGILVAVALGPAAGRWRALARVVVGGLVPTLVAVGAFAVMGHLRTFLDDFLLINLRYTHQRSLTDDPVRGWNALRDGYGWSLWVLLIGAAALLVIGVVGVARRGGRHDPRAAAVAGVGAALVAGATWSARAFNSWPDAFLLLPCAAVGIGGLAALLAHRTPRPAAVAVALAWVVAATAGSLSYAVGSRDHTLDEQRRDVAAVTTRLPAGARILSVDAPQVLVLSGERNPSRFQIFSSGLTAYLEHTWPGGRDGYGEWVDERAPAVIVIGGGPGAPGWLDPVIATHYERVGRSPGWTWFVRDTLPAETRQQIRAALGLLV